ncbi:MAG: sigma 54-interacting transcriptional regulator [Lentisphaerae bacterium]|nr:sigma 54-interacting transcriptional regulator [Lentisphaerota bacterium]
MIEPDLSQKRASEVVDRYVTTDLPLITILQEVKEPRSLLAQAILHLHDCLEGRRLAKDAVAMAQAVPLVGWDPELLILFLGSWAELSCRIGRPSIAQALIHRARALFVESTHPEVIATIMLVESILADTTGNKLKCERILKEILTTISANSSRRRLYVWELALFLALQGRGMEARSEMSELNWQSSDRFKASRVLIVQFTDAVETGRTQEASQLMSDLQANLHSQKDIGRIPFRAYQDLLALMHLRPEDTPLPLPDAERQNLKWVAVIHALLRRDTDDALRLARLEANRVLGSIFTSGFDSFNLIRAELAAGNGESALRLIKMRQGRGNRHYLDDLFAARAQRLMSNRNRAVEHFAELLKAIEVYRSKGRLDFELRLACELSRGDIVDLTRSAEKRIQRLKAQPEAQTGSLPASPAADSEITPVPGIDAEEVDEATRLGVNIIRGKSALAAQIRDAVMRFADLDAPVLVTGETGTGKELVARALHLVSKRRNKPFTVVNCGAITETLLESELFGHERGAFTGAEKANKGLFEATGEGTILLDEIGDISPRLQGSLLRVMETGEIRAVGSTRTRQIACRIVAATNADLAALAEDGRFRRDLIFRLQRLGIDVPPLRDRRDDILPLARHFLDLGRRIGVHATMTDDLREALRAYDWPGNIRELRNVIERMRLMHSDKLAYGFDDLDLRFQTLRPRATTPPASPPPGRSLPPSAGNRPPITMPSAPTPPPPSMAVPPKQLIRPGTRPMLARSPDGSMSDEQVDHMVKKGRSPLRRLDRLRALFTRYGKLTRKEAIEILGVSPNTATRDLQILCDEGFIRCVEPSQSSRSRYFERMVSPEGPPRVTADASPPPSSHDD